MKYIRYLFLACLGVALIAVALANRNMVSLKLMPDGARDRTYWAVVRDDGVALPEAEAETEASGSR